MSTFERFLKKFGSEDKKKEEAEGKNVAQGATNAVLHKETFRSYCVKEYYG